MISPHPIDDDSRGWGDEGMRMLEGIDTRTEMVMDVDQVGRENLN